MKIELVDPSSLSFHPLLKQLPDPDSELLTRVANDIAENGIRDALIVDEKNRVMSGRVRLKAALTIELPELPIRRASSADAATIIVHSLLQRAHYSKSALAYLTFPFFEIVLQESRARRIENLKQHAERTDSTQNVLSGRSAEDVARQAGVSRALFFQAGQVHKLFAKHPEAKKQLEPQILCGDLSLGYAINGVAGILSTRGKARGADDQLELFGRTVNALRIRFAKWDSIAPAKRMFVANEFAEAIAEAPEEIRDRIFAKLHANRKAAAR
jgi:hypothetical protein